jgi:hypothetical protein
MTTNRHPTGWMSNSERALTQVAFRLPQQTVDQLKHAAALAGVSQRTALKEAICDFAEKQRSTRPRHQPPQQHLPLAAEKARVGRR